MKKRRNAYEVDLDVVKDPAGVRHVMEAVSTLRARSPRADLDPLVSAVEGLSLLIPRNHPYASQLNALFGVWQELLTGRGLKLDRNGEPEIADLLQEMSDWLGELAGGKGVIQFLTEGADEESQEG